MEESDFKNHVWSDLVHNKIQVNLNFLAGKILLARWHIALKNNNSFAEAEKAKKEVFELYFKNKELPSVKKDIMLLLKK
jgi:hypothetical protein